MIHPQQPSGMPTQQVRAVPASSSRSTLPDRTWPDQVMTQAPRWCAVDLRDGNQALIDPMDAERKMRMFKLLVQMGYKEIEVGFPQRQPDRLRLLPRAHRRRPHPGRRDDPGAHPVPRPPHRAHLRRRSAARSRRSCTSTTRPRCCSAASCSGMSEEGIIDIALQGARLCRKLEETVPETTVYYEYSPGVLHRHRARVRGAHLQRGASTVIDPTPDHKMIINLPATVEMATPNVYADSIEWMVAPPRPPRVGRRVSLHPHNDRGRASRRPSSATWPAPTASRAACSATASAPATSAW